MIDYVLPSNGTLYSPCPTLAEALAQWSPHFAQLETMDEPKACLRKPEWIDNGYNRKGYYTSEAQVVDVRYRYSKRGQWRYDQLVFADSCESIPCRSDGSLL